MGTLQKGYQTATIVEGVWKNGPPHTAAGRDFDNIVNSFKVETQTFINF
jgi:hypothetical protein